MPNRVIKESIWTSPNFNKLSPLAERHFCRILTLADDHGCFESTPNVVKGRCYPLRDEVSGEDIASWQDELQDQEIIIRWNTDGREYAIFPKFHLHQRIRSTHNRKTPAPPDEVADICRQLTASDGLNPNLNPNHNHNPNLNPNLNLNPPNNASSCPADVCQGTAWEEILRLYRQVELGSTEAQAVKHLQDLYAIWKRDGFPHDSAQQLTQDALTDAIDEGAKSWDDVWRMIFRTKYNPRGRG